MPREAQDPVVVKQTGQGYALMYLSFNSNVLTASQITDYLTRVVQPKLQTIDGVANAQILGGQTFAMRIWLDPTRWRRSASRRATCAPRWPPTTSPPPPARSRATSSRRRSTRRPRSTAREAFGKLVVAARGDALMRLADIARIELGPESANSSSVFDGLKAVFIGIYATPTANPLTVIDDVRKAFPDIQAQLPPGMEAAIAYDATKFIDASI